MNGRNSVAWVLVWLAGAGWCAAAEGTAPLAPSQGSDLFTHGPVLELVIDLDPAALDSLRREPRRPVPGAVQEGERVYPDVDVHLKGALGSFRGVDDKPCLSLSFNKRSPGRRFHGLRRILLNNSVQDPSYLNEALAGGLFRAAGVPAPRTTHALVTLNGRKLGLYVLKEGFSKDLLRLHFGNTEGNFYDLNQGFYDLGSGGDLNKRFRLDSGRSAPAMSDLAELIAACQEKDLAQRWTRLEAILDVDQCVSFMAVEILTCHVDGYSVYGHNFRLYHNPATRRLVFIPNDLDRMFQQCRPSLPKPGFSALVSAALYQTPEGRRRYEERSGWVCTNAFNLERMTNQVQELSSRLRTAHASWNPQAAGDFDSQARLVCDRLRQRAEQIRHR